MLTVHRDEDAGNLVCRVEGELDAYTVGRLREVLDEMARAPRLVIDLSGVSFVDAAGLGALIGGVRRSRDLGGHVAVASSRPALLRLLHIIGFDRIVTVSPTMEEAARGLEEADRERGNAGGRQVLARRAR